MEKSETKVLSIRLDKKLENEARKLNINIKGVVEEALKEKIARAKTKKLSKILKEALTMTGINENEWIRSVRETRDER